MAADGPVLGDEHCADCFHNHLWNVMRGLHYLVEKEQGAGRLSVSGLGVAAGIGRLREPVEQVERGYICYRMCWATPVDRHIRQAPAVQLVLESWAEMHCKLPVLAGSALLHAASALHGYDELLPPFFVSGLDVAFPWSGLGCIAGRGSGRQRPRPYAVTTVQETHLGTCRRVSVWTGWYQGAVVPVAEVVWGELRHGCAEAACYVAMEKDCSFQGSTEGSAHAS